jgi:hypothetical protein
VYSLPLWVILIGTVIPQFFSRDSLKIASTQTFQILIAQAWHQFVLLITIYLIQQHRYLTVFFKN